MVFKLATCTTGVCAMTTMAWVRWTTIIYDIRLIVKSLLSVGFTFYVTVLGLSKRLETHNRLVLVLLQWVRMICICTLVCRDLFGLFEVLYLVLILLFVRLCLLIISLLLLYSSMAGGCGNGHLVILSLRLSTSTTIGQAMFDTLNGLVAV